MANESLTPSTNSLHDSTNAPKPTCKPPPDGSHSDTGPEQGNNRLDGPAGSGPAPEPLPGLKPRRKIDLTRAALPEVGSMGMVESLLVREMKGVGAMFTPNLEAALTFYSLIYKPEGEFDPRFQIVTGDLLNDPRVMRRDRKSTRLNSSH